MLRVMSQVAADWAALDTGGVPFALRDRETADGVASHRRFEFGPPSSSTEFATGDAELVEHEVDVTIHFRRSGLTSIDWASFLDSQTRLLRSTVEGRPSWPEGVQDVQVTSAAVSVDDEDAEVTLTLLALISHDSGDDSWSAPLAWSGPSSDYIIVELTQDTLVGSGAGEVGEVPLYAGDWVMSAKIWNDTSTADAADVTLRLWLDSTEIASVTTSSTSSADVSTSFNITSAGTYTLTLETDTVTGVGRVDSATFERV